MTKFAEGTTVDPSRSQAEIISTLRRYGAKDFMYGQEGDRGIVAFKAHGKLVRFELPLEIDREQFRWTPSRRNRRDEIQIDAAVEGEHRRRWRALALAIKAKLEVVETGISSFEEEFLAHIVLPTGQTVGEYVVPQLDNGTDLKMLPAGSGSAT